MLIAWRFLDRTMSAASRPSVLDSEVARLFPTRLLEELYGRTILSRGKKILQKRPASIDSTYGAYPQLRRDRKVVHQENLLS